MFPDPTKSPAHYTRNLVIYCVEAITAEDAQEGSWLQRFSRVVQLELDINPKSFDPHPISLAPFHKFSPSVKSLRVTGSTILPAQIFHLIYSLHLLENLKLDGHNAYNWGLPPAPVDLSTSPVLTGTLELAVVQLGIEIYAHGLVCLPNGLRFCKLILTCCCNEDLRWTEELVAACSDTLECFDVTYYLPGAVVLCSRAESVTYPGL